MRLASGDVIAAIETRFSKKIPTWKLRRVLDSLEQSNAIEIQRVGPYRTVDQSAIETIVAELQRLGWLPAEPVSAGALTVKS